MVMFDVVEAILFRLPAYDVLRCKSVHKSWYSLISTPSFAKTHFKLNCNKEEDKTRKIAKITSYLESPGFLPDEWMSYNRWIIVGSCNGLVCLHARNRPDHEPRLCVTNPVTGAFRELQAPPRLIAGENHCFGFGYDSSSDDYKVVLPISQQGKGVIQILSLKSNVWRHFGIVNYRFDDAMLSDPGILFNGALHWFWLNSDDATLQNILLVSFNLATEEFTEIPQPNDSRYVWNYGCSLGIFQGRLCIFPSGDQDFYYPPCGTWVMKSYNSYSWELLPKDSEKSEHAIHYMLKDTDEYRITPPPTYFCDTNIQLSRNKEHIGSPMFVPTLVSPYVDDNNGGPSHTKNNKSVQEKREIQEVYSVEEKEQEKEIAIGLLDVEVRLT